MEANLSAPASPPSGGEAAGLLPALTLPSGGGAIRGIGETFGAVTAAGTGRASVPIAVSPARSGFGPTLGLTYESGNGNGPFGFGWTLPLPKISRRTDRGLPRYAEDTDVFVMSDVDDLVPALDGANGWLPDRLDSPPHAPQYRIDRYRPRIEGAFERIERWTRLSDGDTHWRSTTRDNVTTWFGTGPGSRIADPSDPSKIFTWLIERTQDDRGNAVVYEYAADDGLGVDTSQSHERNRTAMARATNRYPKRVRYGNRTSHLTDPRLSDPGWMFEIVFDYGDHDAAAPQPVPSSPWPCRADPFSTYRSGFEVGVPGCHVVAGRLPVCAGRRRRRVASLVRHSGCSHDWYW